MVFLSTSTNLLASCIHPPSIFLLLLGYGSEGKSIAWTVSHARCSTYVEMVAEFDLAFDLILRFARLGDEKLSASQTALR